jgi:hypothetical protein
MPSTLDQASGRWPEANDECWAPVLGFEGLYDVSSDGRVKSLERTTLRIDGRTVSIHERILKPAQRAAGYLHVCLRKDGSYHTRTVHKLVLEAFVGKRPSGMECCHCNGDPSDNRLINLRWDTPKSNGYDRRLHGTNNHGFTNPRSCLSSDQIVQIRNQQGSNAEVAARFGVCAETVRRIKKSIRWASVETC